MTDTLLALIPTYGLWIIFASLILSCLALPVPSSILVMAAGGFAAGGDLVLWQVILIAFAGFVIGDQLAYGVARRAGPGITDHLRKRPRMERVLLKAEAMLQKRGPVAVFLSRTIFSPLGPYMGYLSGALKLNWLIYSLTAALGAACWSLAYTYLGYTFASQITQVASLISNSIGVIMALAAIVLILIYVRRSWQRFQKDHAVQRS